MSFRLRKYSKLIFSGFISQSHDIRVFIIMTHVCQQFSSIFFIAQSLSISLTSLFIMMHCQSINCHIEWARDFIGLKSIIITPGYARWLCVSYLFSLVLFLNLSLYFSRSSCVLLSFFNLPLFLLDPIDYKHSLATFHF